MRLLGGISLTLCFGWPARELPEVGGFAVTVTPAGGDEVVLDPWPLAADTVEVAVRARTLTARFDDEAALHAALAATPYHVESWRLRPA